MERLTWISADMVSGIGYYYKDFDIKWRIKNEPQNMQLIIYIIEQKPNHTLD